MEGIWSLPGPAQFTGDIRARLDRGAAVLAVLPQVASDGFRSELLAAVDYGFDVLDSWIPPERPLSSVIAERLGIDDIEAGADAVAALARHPVMLGRPVAVTLGDKPDERERWATFLQAFLAAARTVAVADRPRLLVLGGHECAASLARAELLETQWWWGVLDRLDTASLVRREHFGRGGNGLLRDTVTEVAGFDLRLACHLAAEWDGDERTLPDALAGYQGLARQGAAVPSELPHSSTPLDAPPAAMLALWDQGLVDAWDAFPVYLHPCCAPREALRQRIWRAQIRCLMPQIDEERARIAVWLRREVRTAGEDEILEPGDLYEIMQANPALKSWRGGHRYRLVCWLRQARNQLAHLNVLAPEDIAHGQRLSRTDRQRG
jgi:hypothetical protein